MKSNMAVTYSPKYNVMFSYCNLLLQEKRKATRPSSLGSVFFYSIYINNPSSSLTIKHIYSNVLVK